MNSRQAATPMPVSLKDLRPAFEFVSMGTGTNNAFLCKETGKIYWTSESGDLDGLEEEELPDDLEESDKYLAIPDKYELHLGKPLALAFAREFLPAYFDEVRHMFSKRGAYRRFRDFLLRRNALDQWYEFEERATDRALREWCEVNSITLAD
jgi:hypothetical protein